MANDEGGLKLIILQPDVGKTSELPTAAATAAAVAESNGDEEFAGICCGCCWVIFEFVPNIRGVVGAAFKRAPVRSIPDVFVVSEVFRFLSIDAELTLIGDS